jgi:hypothetical protein
MKPTCTTFYTGFATATSATSTKWNDHGTSGGCSSRRCPTPYAAASRRWKTQLHLTGGKSVHRFTDCGLRRASLLPSSRVVGVSSSSPSAGDSFIAGRSSSPASTAYRLHIEGLGPPCVSSFSLLSPLLSAKCRKINLSFQAWARALTLVEMKFWPAHYSSSTPKSPPLLRTLFQFLFCFGDVKPKSGENRLISSFEKKRTNWLLKFADKRATLPLVGFVQGKHWL